MDILLGATIILLGVLLATVAAHLYDHTRRLERIEEWGQTIHGDLDNLSRALTKDRRKVVKVTGAKYDHDANAARIAD